MVIEGLRRSSSPKMQEKAYEIAEKWVLTNLFVYEKTENHMWEKYSVNGSYPQTGSGGEYDVQDGFGWTNGVILDLLVTYSDRMLYPSLQTNENNNEINPSQALPQQSQVDNNVIFDNTPQYDYSNAVPPASNQETPIILASLALYRLALAFE